MKKSNIDLSNEMPIYVLLSLLLFVSASALPPQGQDVEITQPVRIEHEVFGRANYYDPEGDRESNSTYAWYKVGNPVPIASGTLSKVMLIHFDGSLTSEEGYVPVNTSGITFVQGQDGFGQAVEIGQGDVLAYNWPYDCNIVNGLTIEMWVKPYWNSDEPDQFHTSGQDNYLFYEQTNYNNYVRLVHWGRETNGASGALRLEVKSDQSGAVEFCRNITWQQNSWHHVCITLGQGKINFYVDGQSSREYNYTRAAQPIRFYLGSDQGSQRFLHGAIDELRISNRKISADEINLRYQRHAPFYEQETMLELNDNTFAPGEEIIFEYIPRSANGGQGTPARSQREEIQTFTSSINIDVTGQLTRLNRDLLGVEIAYDEHEPGLESEGGEGPYGGAGTFIWDLYANESRKMTVDWVSPLKIGISRLKPWSYARTGTRYFSSWPPTLGETETFIDRMMEFTDADHAKMQNYSDGPLVAPYIFRMSTSDGWLPYPQSIDGYPLPENDPWGAANAYYDLVNYCNNQMGYNIKYWETANEPYAESDGYDVANYANIYGNRMKQADPSARTVVPVSTENANVVFDNIDRNYVDDIQIHTYTCRVVDGNEDYPEQGDPEFITDFLFPDLVGGSVESIEETYKYFRNKLMTYFPDNYQEMKIHVTEYNVHNLINEQGYLHNLYMTAQTMLGAISRASFTNMLLRTNLVNTAQLFEFGFGTGPHTFLNRPGQTPPRSPDGNPTITYLGAQLYADFLGEKLAKVNVDSYTFDSPGNPVWSGDPLPPYQNLFCLDVLATITNDRRKLYVIVVNRDISEQGNRDITARINLTGFTPKDEALVRRLNVDPSVHNHPWPDILLESITYGPLHFGDNDQDCYNPAAIPVTEATIDGVSASFEYTFPAHSITAFEFSKRISPWPAIPRSAR